MRAQLYILIASCIVLGYLIKLLVESFKKGGLNMKVTTFSEEVAKREGKKVPLKIGQIKEVLRVANDLLNGELYKMIRAQ